MIFAHDTEVALAAAAALVNTAPDASDGSVEELPDVAALEAFLTPWQWTGIRAHDDAELAAVRRLRPRLARVWQVEEGEAVDIVNELLRDFRALPQLVKHDGWAYHLHATPSEAPLANRMAVEAAMALTDVIRMGELSRLRVCAADDCNNVVVDLSKNRSRRYCEAGCGNRANVAAYRARRIQEIQQPSAALQLNEPGGRRGGASAMDLTLRPLDRADLPRLGQWIAASHVQPWWREAADLASVEAAYGPAIDGADPTELFVVQLDGRPIGFIQRCLLRDNSDYGEALSHAGTDPDAATIDYLIGDPTLVGRGLGSRLIAAFVADTWVRHPDVDSIVVAVQQDNVPSWRVLEKSGFRRVWSGVVDSGHPSDDGDSHVYELSRVAYGIPRNDQQP